MTTLKRCDRCNVEMPYTIRLPRGEVSVKLTPTDEYSRRTFIVLHYQLTTKDDDVDIDICKSCADKVLKGLIRKLAKTHIPDEFIIPEDSNHGEGE